MSPFLRKVKTASGATAVQIVEKRHGIRTILEHLGSAHDEAELAALIQAGREKMQVNQPMLDITVDGGVRPGVAVVDAKRSQLLVDAVRGSWQRLGFDVVEYEAFFQLAGPAGGTDIEAGQSAGGGRTRPDAGSPVNGEALPETLRWQ